MGSIDYGKILSILFYAAWIAWSRCPRKWKDGSLSQIYCSYCYVNGAFVEPDITFEQMVNKGKTVIANGQGNALVKFFMKASYPMMLKKTQRWKA